MVALYLLEILAGCLVAFVAVNYAWALFTGATLFRWLEARERLKEAEAGVELKRIERKAQEVSRADDDKGE
ncbi:MAG TPA: hypothetical protein VFG76_12895 [Candidatus Polarisedimenticolia bacterium]|nr:hypothetical protein [Candidatus Polarisedimenticolia bacterium]